MYGGYTPHTPSHFHNPHILFLIPTPTPHTGEMIATGLLPSPGKKVKRVTATDGSQDAFKGKCVFFLRPNNTKPVAQSNIAEMLLCGYLDASKGRSVLEVVQEYLSKIMLPALQSGSHWGPLQPTQVNTFMNTLKAYVNFLHSKTIVYFVSLAGQLQALVFAFSIFHFLATNIIVFLALLLMYVRIIGHSPFLLVSGSQLSIETAIHLSLDCSVDLEKLKNSDGCIASARLPEVVTALEDLASGWCQQIEQVSV